MRICVHKTTGKIIEMQSLATAGTLIQNALNAGYSVKDIVERVVTPAEYEALKALDPDEIIAQAERAAQEAVQTAKAQAYIDNLPSWFVVETAVDDISNLAEAKAFIKKLARVVYWLAKDQAD